MQATHRLYRNNAIWSDTPGRENTKLANYTVDMQEQETKYDQTHMSENFIENAYRIAPMVNISELSFTNNKAVGVMGKLPAFIQLYVVEMNESTQKVSQKAVSAGFLTIVISFFGMNLIDLVVGLFFVAVLDLILGLIPGNVKQGTEKDHGIQAKLLAFTTNFFSLLVFVKGGEYLRTYTADNVVAGLVANNIHYAVAAWIFSIYFYRVVKYIAQANKVKIPPIIKKFF